MNYILKKILILALSLTIIIAFPLPYAYIYSHADHDCEHQSEHDSHSHDSCPICNKISICKEIINGTKTVDSKNNITSTISDITYYSTLAIGNVKSPNNINSLVNLKIRLNN